MLKVIVLLIMLVDGREVPLQGYRDAGVCQTDARELAAKSHVSTIKFTCQRIPVV